MFTQIFKSLVWWALIGALMLFTVKYIVGSLVMPGMDASGNMYSTDRYDSYLSQVK